MQDTIDELYKFEWNKLAKNQIGNPEKNTARTLLYSNSGGKTSFWKYYKKKGHHIDVQNLVIIMLNPIISTQNTIFIVYNPDLSM